MRYFLILFVAVIACTPAGQVRTGHNAHTQVSFAATTRQPIAQTSDSLLAAAPIVLTHRPTGQERYAVTTSVMRDDGNFPHISQVWSFGRVLPYRKLDRRYEHCSTGCLRAETGVIAFTETAFAHAAQAGFTFQMIGKRGTYTGTLPASAFARVLAAEP